MIIKPEPMKRTLFMSVLSAFLLVALLQSCKTTTEVKSRQIYVRRNAHSAAAQPDIVAYGQAMDSMRKLDCTDPRSWYYQGAIHNLPDYKKYLEAHGDSLCPAFKGQLYPAWASCPHMKPGYVQYHFLTWHRLYLYYLEKIVRKISGKSDFALPYWNYSVVSQRTLPEKFRTVGDPLYTIERSPSLMAGQLIDSVSTDVIVINQNGSIIPVDTLAMDAILDTTYLWTASDIHVFSQELEDVIHNCMHDYVGAAVYQGDIDQLGNLYNSIYQANAKAVGGTLMGNVPSSAFDPIFYFHHSNIDRLWAEWEHSYPNLALTLPEFEKAGWGQVNYTFFDENGKQVQYTSLQQVYDSIRHLDYTYDGLQRDNKTLELAAVKPLVSSLKKVSAELSPSNALTTSSHEFTVTLDEPLAAAEKNKSFYTLEMEVSFAHRPMTRLAVILLGDTPPAGQAVDIHHYLAGWIGFFGASHVDGAGGHHDHDKPKKFIKLDITEELTRQQAFGKKEIKVVLQLDRPDPSNPITVDKLSIRSYQQQ